MAASIVTLQAPVPVQAPDQPLKTEPASARTLRLTVVPEAKLPLQVAPQEIPAGDEVTVPAPVPDLETVRLFADNAVVEVNVAETPPTVDCQDAARATEDGFTHHLLGSRITSLRHRFQGRSQSWLRRRGAPARYFRVFGATVLDRWARNAVDDWAESGPFRNVHAGVGRAKMLPAELSRTWCAPKVRAAGALKACM